MSSNIFQLLKSKTTRYIIFRSQYELKRKIGLLVRKYPTDLTSVVIPSLTEWRDKACGWFFEGRESLKFSKIRNSELREKMKHMLKGDVLFFSKTWLSLGFDYDWVTNPETGYHYDINQHWTRVNDFSEEAGDIKFVWEKSRFSWLLTVCRYDYHFDEDHAEFAIGQIIDWIKKNPLNCGPNYKCSQETSIRILNWLFTLSFYRKNEALTEKRWKYIMTSIYWQTEHVFKNINFSRIAVRNNHAITETLTLYLMGLLFPQMPHASKWKRNGKRWFEQEIDYQIEADGTYIQDSMNYHRVVIQLLSYAIAIAERQGELFSDFVYEKAYKSLNFLYQCQEPSNGWLPNYGANDGSLFFPLSDASYRDYRPQLDALHQLLTGESLYNEKFEDSQWIGGVNTSLRARYPKLERQINMIAFEKAGYYLIRDIDSLTFIRCGLFKNKGSTDQLHVDVWYRGENLLIDGGSYKYNTNKEIVRYFAGTESHNTVMLGVCDQMQKGPRFLWFYPPKILSVVLREDVSYYTFEGGIIAYKKLGTNITIRRKIKKKKGSPEWEVIDIIEKAPDSVVKRQLWHTKSDDIVFESAGDRIEKSGWYSDFYGVMEKNNQVEFSTKGNSIETRIRISE